MDKIRLGRTGMNVSRIGFGGIPIQRDTEEDAIKVVRKCLELGINFLDTANGYTTSEERIGKAVNGRRKNVFIATKSTSRATDGVKEHLALSLKRLGTDYIDLYQFHNVSDAESLEKILAPGGPLEAVRQAQKEGKIKHIGITSHSRDMAIEAVKTDNFETVMFPFNFITLEAANDLIPLCRQHDVGFIAMKPFAGGQLDDPALAFKYLLQFPDVLPIPGIEKPEEIEEIVRIIEGSTEMTEAEKQKMQKMRDELGTRFCRRCNYCQPCQMNIPISSVMTSVSFYKRMPPERFFTENINEAMGKAAECIECGECEERCPYKLPIRDMLVELREWYQQEKEKYLKQVKR